MKTQHPSRRFPARPLMWTLTAIALVQLCSCIQPPPPRTYNPKMAKHLRNLSHDTPVTPIPYGGCGYYYWGY